MLAAGCRESNEESGDAAPMCGNENDPTAPAAVADGVYDHPCAPVDGGPIDEFIAWFSTADRDALFDGAVDRLAAGLTSDQLVAGLYIAHVTFSFHRDEHWRLAVPSAQRAGGHGTAHHELLPLLWCLRRTHPDAIGTSVCPAPGAAADPSAAALLRLQDALEAWDQPAADAALVAALRGGQLPTVRDVLLEYGSRTHDWIGHTMIEATQAMRVLVSAGNRGAEPILRGLLRTMMRGSTSSSAPFDANRKRLLLLPDDWESGGADEGATLELLAELRTADDEGAAALAAQMLREGVGPRAIWDATRPATAELTLRFTWPQWIKFPLHAVTSNNALRLAYDSTCDDRLRRLLVLQAVAWVPLHREKAIEYLPSEPPPGWEIDTLEPTGDVSIPIETLLDDADLDRRAGVAQALGWLRDGGDPDVLRARFLELCVGYTFEEHELKFPIAALEEVDAASPVFRERLLAAALAYGASTTNGLWTGHDEALAALARL